MEGFRKVLKKFEKVTKVSLFFRMKFELVFLCAILGSGAEYLYVRKGLANGNSR